VEISSGFLHSVQMAFAEATSGWHAAVFPYAQKLFFLLFAIELTWSGIKWTLEKDDGLPVAVGLLRHLVAYGFFYSMLVNAPEWFGALVNGFGFLGQRASGLEALNPSSVIEQGLVIVQKMFSPMKEAGLLGALVPGMVGAFSAVIVMLSFVVVAAQMLITHIEAAILLSGGVVMLGFGGSSFSRNFSERYVSYAFSVGVKLFVIYLIVGVGGELTADWGETLFNDGRFSVNPMMEVLGVSVIYAILAWNVPSLAGSMLSGQVSMQGSSVVAGSLAAGAVAGRASRSGARGVAAGGELGVAGVAAAKIERVSKGATSSQAAVAGVKKVAKVGGREALSSVRRVAVGKEAVNDTARHSFKREREFLVGKLREENEKAKKDISRR